ncbi:amidohydrolase family protein [Pigmentiphaga aceris]|uniref:Amidohydrolase family protein n=1 Tax=Pigmentiphaga aceris TaxID=1940612 RepID=A0A5C0AQZ6_9BURK|nr:amidohydrolase family protein [Pigmentiphaga aceris]QEI04502.1 amidohydrolase family protein [Pigmentiphaga aceris]
MPPLHGVRPRAPSANVAPAARPDLTPDAVPFSAGTHRPLAALPADACDCHIHVYDKRYPTAVGARLSPPDASIADYQRLQARIGTTRAVLVTPSTYGTDNRCMLDGLAALGAQARGVAVIDGSESDAELQGLDDLGVRGVRLNLSLGVTGSIDALQPLAHRIADLGWHLQLLMAPDLLAGASAVLRRLPVPLVFDHFGRIAPAQVGTHPAHALLLDLLAEGRAWIKLSGGYLVSPIHTTDDLALHPLASSYLAAAPDRVLWGSDWPHATASAGAQPMPDDARQVDCLAEWIRSTGTGNTATLHRVLVDNPQALYGFAPAEPSSH